MKVFFNKNILFYIFGYLLDYTCIEIWWFFLNFGWILGTENLKKIFFLGTLSIIIIIIISFLAIFSQIKVGKKKGGCKFLLVPTLLIGNLAYTTTLLPWQLPQLANLFIFRNVEIFDIIIIIIILKLKNSIRKSSNLI